MSIGVSNYTMLTPEQANPVFTGMKAGSDIAHQQLQNQQMQQQLKVNPQMLQQELMKMQLANQSSQAVLPTVGPRAQADLVLAQAQGNWYPAEAAARTKLQGAQAGLAGSEEAKNRYMLNNPAYMAGGIPAQIAALLDLQKTNPQAFNAMQATNGNNPQTQGAPQLLPANAPQNQMPNYSGGGQQSPQQQQMQMQQAGYQTPNYMQSALQNFRNGPLPGLGGGMMPGQMPQMQQQMQSPSLAAQIGANQQAQMQQQMPSPQMQQGPQQQSLISPQLIGNMIKGMELPGARAERTEQLTAGASFLNMPPDSKRLALAQARAMGYSDDQAMKSFLSGKSLEKIAEEKGFGTDPSRWPSPEDSYLPTIATQTRNQQRQAAVSELATVEPFINAATAPYAQRFNGYSPAQIMDSLSSMSLPDALSDVRRSTAHLPEKERERKVADFLAARIIIPEYNAVRARSMGVQNIGVEAMRAIGAASLNEFKILEPQLTPNEYRMANETANKKIAEMNQAAKKANLVPIFSGPKNNLSGQNINGNDIAAAAAADVTGGKVTGDQIQNATKGPKDGATATLNGSSYKFVNGEWHKQ